MRLVRDALTTTRRAGVTGQILVRADSAYYQHAFVTAVTKAGACFSVGARQDSAVRRAIASIDDQAWVRIEYPQAVLDPDTGELVSCAEVAEVPYLAFTSHGSKAVPGRLIVRRVPERNTNKLADAAQEGLFTVWRYHAIFTNNPAPLVVAESQHRGHAIVEQVIADLKAGPLAHLPSGRFQANAAWLVAATIAFNLTRAIGVAAGGTFTRAEAATVRARILNVPARVSRSGRRQRLHLPQRWPWASAVADPLDDGDDHLTTGPIRPDDPRNQEKPDPTGGIVTPESRTTPPIPSGLLRAHDQRPARWIEARPTTAMADSHPPAFEDHSHSGSPHIGWRWQDDR